MASADTGERKIVSRIDVAVSADRTVVRLLEGRVGEYCAQPCCCRPRRMARDTAGWVRSGHVIRYVCAVGLCLREIRCVATIAICGRVSGCIVPTDVAIRAGIDHRSNRAGNSSARRQHVRSQKWETCRAVIKFSIHPRDRVVARRAHGGGEICLDVIRHVSAKCRRTRPRRHVAAVAVRVRHRERVIVVYVAVRAGNYLACRGQLV
jgi:hypothetical protein